MAGGSDPVAAGAAAGDEAAPVSADAAEVPVKRGAGLVLLTLASGQFLMTLDSSVMNVSIATVAKDVGTTVTGIQTAITLYTLVMAMFMVTGGKLGSMVGRRRAFAIGCLIYGIGSLTTALAPSLAILVLGWSFLEGIGAALIMPAIVALVAGNFPPRGRPRAYGLVMAAGAIAIAVGPLIGGFATTYFSWRRVFAGEVLLVWLFLGWERRLEARGAEPLVRPELLANHELTGGLLLFFYQFLVQAGLFFAIPLYLSVALGLSAIETGVRILPLSLTLLLAAAGIPRFFPNVSPRLVVRLGLLAMLAGIVALFTSIDPSAGAEIVTVPLLLAGLGIGALASQLGAVTVSAVPDEQSAEVGGLQNTGTNLGASIGTALAGSILIAALTASFLQGIEQNPAVPASVKTQANVKLAGGVPFLSDADLQAALDKAGVGKGASTAILDVNQQARLDGLRAALVALAAIALLALSTAPRIPTKQPGSAPRQRSGRAEVVVCWDRGVRGPFGDLVTSPSRRSRLRLFTGWRCH